MPTVEFECDHCGHKFRRVAFKGEDVVESSCPNCGSQQVKQRPGPKSLFHDKAPFGELFKDTN